MARKIQISLNTNMALPTRMFVRAVLGQKITFFNRLQQFSVSLSFVPTDNYVMKDKVRHAFLSNTFRTRFLSTTNSLLCQAEALENDDASNKAPVKKMKSRVKPYTYHPVEVGIRYMESAAYTEVYGNEPVWTNYRRNFKGQFKPFKARPSCLINTADPHINTASPCPICRDEYLVVHHQNTKLLKQFISPYTGKILSAYKTGLCGKVQFKLELEIMKAYDLGLIEYDVPFREYDYSLYYPQLRKQHMNII
ncbi:28S ribosomal protein S18b [Tropilaelaps mercedesae]|uniref:Small ribosomal subunit protein mS40 n=1 Tax=Tropilaelaps mercedesae TaxID=418985 RepID=A0A1V9XB47_9ACAR|nr:28S ribosomal protein S18b [Tropilaelaps mercedesae]